MILLFDDKTNSIHVLQRTATFRAGNVVDSRAKGEWPVGVFRFETLVPVTGEEGSPAGKFGGHFIKFVVPGRTGMGIHAGRKDVADGRGRKGIFHATYGCIRMQNQDLAEVAAMHGNDPITHLVVEREEEA